MNEDIFGYSYGLPDLDLWGLQCDNGKENIGDCWEKILNLIKNYKCIINYIIYN